MLQPSDLCPDRHKQRQENQGEKDDDVDPLPDDALLRRPVHLLCHVARSLLTAGVEVPGGAAAIYGAVTKRSLAGLGGILFMGLIGLIVAMVINVFVGWETLNVVISIVGIVIFTALTAYDVQRIQNGELAIATGSMEKGAVIGALHLYLDFINLFLFLLRFTGGRRN